jgi:methyl-accepting chemotaxis protein
LGRSKVSQSSFLEKSSLFNPLAREKYPPLAPFLPWKKEDWEEPRKRWSKRTTGSTILREASEAQEKDMRWLLDRKIGTKQILAFGVVVALTTFLGVFALIRLADVRATTVDMSEHRIPAIQSLSELRAGLMTHRVGEMSYVFTNDDEEREVRIANMQSGMDQVNKATAELAALIDNPAEKKLYDAIITDIAQTNGEAQTIIGLQKNKKSADAVSEVLGNGTGDFSQSMSDVQDEIDLKVKGAQEASKASAKVYQTSQWWILGLLIAVVAVSSLVIVATIKLIVKPVCEVGVLLGRIATGDVTGKELKLDRADEIGELARSINLVQKSLRTTIASIATGAEQIAAASKEFAATSQQIASNSEETSAQAKVVSLATEEVNRNLQTVTLSTEQMSTSISEIAKNAAEAAKEAGQALKAAVQTNAAMTKLGESSGEIGQVIKVITTIAQQTNLLALNATIEAARAGESGRGFAVVANEVKELSNQTAKATADIGHRIAAIQSDTKSAVDAISTFGSVIGRVNAISATIATAVEQQSVTTSEMSRNVAEAAKGSDEVARNISGVAQAAQNTLSGTSESQKAARDLAEMSTQLRGLVDQFKVKSDEDEPVLLAAGA